MASISGQSTSNIDNVDGFFTTQGGGGTATTTPTITGLSDNYGDGSLVVGNYATDTVYQCQVYIGATLIVSNALTIKNGANISWLDSSALTGTRTVKLRAQKFGDFIQSAEATGTYEKLAISFRYFRIQGVDADGTFNKLQTGVKDWRYYTAVSYGGTEYPSDMTTDALPTPFVASGYNFSNYSPFKAFDSSLSTWWWSLSVSAASLNHLTIDMGAQTTMLSGRILFYASQSQRHFSIMASNTGAFSGEEVFLNTAIACDLTTTYQALM